MALDLETLDHWASILTAGVAGGAWAKFEAEKVARRLRLERYLRGVAHVGEMAERSLAHLVAAVGMSESQIMDAAFGSRRIERRVREDPSGHSPAEVVLRHVTAA